MRQGLRLLLPLGAILACAFAAPALASEQLTDTNVTFKSLAVNAKGEAVVTYVRSGGQVRHVLAWGAINANAPVDPAVKQVRFKWDYAGGWGKYHSASYWKRVKNACAPYDGPELPYLVAACKAPDGTYWALQSWQRGLPLLGFDPWKPQQTAYELHLSHWSGDLPKLEVYAHWTYGGSWQGLFGRLTLSAASPCTASARRATATRATATAATSTSTPSTRSTAPVGGGSPGILAHRPTGTFCHSFVPQKPFPDYPSQEHAAAGARGEIPRHGDGPGRDAGRRLGGPRSHLRRSRLRCFDHGRLRRDHGGRCPLRRRALGEL